MCLNAGVGAAALLGNLLQQTDAAVMHISAQIHAKVKQILEGGMNVVRRGQAELVLMQVLYVLRVMLLELGRESEREVGKALLILALLVSKHD